MLPIYKIYVMVTILDYQITLWQLIISLQFINNDNLMHSNKQNISTNRTSFSKSKNHPSYQSVTQDYRPTIRVGYSVTKVNNTKSQRITHNHNLTTKQVESKPSKKIIAPISHQEQSLHGKKIVSSAKDYKSGVFVNCEYIKDEPKNQNFHKKNVRESRQKYQSGSNVKSNLSNQRQSRNRMSRSSLNYSNYNSVASQKTLPSYQNVGIKDVMEYHHAGKYRETTVTDKCTKASALSRFCKYGQLHDYDFRKRPECLR